MKSWNSKNIIVYGTLLTLNLLIGLFAIAYPNDLIWAHAYTIFAQIVLVFVVIYPLFVFQSLSPKRGIAKDTPQLIPFIPQTITSLFLSGLKLWPALILSYFVINVLFGSLVSELSLGRELTSLMSEATRTIILTMSSYLIVTLQGIAVMIYTFSKQVNGLKVFIAVMVANALLINGAYLLWSFTQLSYDYMYLPLLVVSIGFFMSQFKRMELIHQ